MQFHFPTCIHFGPGARHLSGSLLRERGFTRPLIITDPVVRALPTFHDFMDQLQQPDLIAVVFEGVQGNPSTHEVTSALGSYHESGCDCILAFGGGAVIDVAKATALLVHHPGSLMDYAEDAVTGKRPIDQPIPMLIALPSTSGTGSEVGHMAVIGDAETGVKRIIRDHKLLPPIVLADPESIVDLPPSMTAATGFDALTHCVESYIARGFHPLSDGIAIEGVRMIAKHLQAAVAKPEDLVARGGMMMAAIMGATAAQKGLGVTHACAQALATVHNLHHGLANGLMLSRCLDFNRSSSESRLAVLGQVVGSTSVHSSERAGDFLRWVDKLKNQIGMPKKLAKSHATRIDEMVAVAMASPYLDANPRPVEREDLEHLFKLVGR